jgi:hypothetical protein
LWERIAEWTDGRIRGYTVRPSTGTARRVVDEAVSFEETPMKVLKLSHGQFGYLFVMNHTDRAGVVESFWPATQALSMTWRATDHSVEIDSISYHNCIIVRDAKRPDGDGRYRGEARAPESEREILANGQLITHKPVPNDELTSDQACQVSTQSLFDELRGKYSVTGDVDATPVGVLRSYLYQIPQFNAAVPEPARPVRATLQQVQHTLIGGPKTELDFQPERGIVQAIRRAQNPALAPADIQRQQPELYANETSDGDVTTSVFSAAYPHPYGSNSQ